MMASVSTLIIGNGAATAVSLVNFCMSLPPSGLLRLSRLLTPASFGPSRDRSAPSARRPKQWRRAGTSHITGMLGQRALSLDVLIDVALAHGLAAKGPRKVHGVALGRRDE